MYIADLHIHSKYSRATSRDCDTAHLDFWARRKGIQLLGTGDFTHSAWRAELAEKLIPAEDGLYRLRDDARLPDSFCQTAAAPRFVLSRGNQFHLQKRRPNPQGSQCNSAALSGGCPSPRPPAGSHRQYPFGWASHPWAGQPGFAGNYAGCLPSGGIYPRPYLDAAFLYVRGFFRL